MRLRRTKYLVEPPAAALSDIAFTLIIFFLVASSSQPDTGKPQAIPSSENKPDQTNESQNVEVSLTEQTIIVNSEVIAPGQVKARLQQLLAGKKSDAQRVVLIKSAEDTSYQRWIDVTELIEEAGGVVTLRLEQQQSVIVP